MTEPKIAQVDTTIRGRLRDRRTRRRSRPTTPGRRTLTRLHLYAPAMRLLHRHGQCLMEIRQPIGGPAQRHCTWCGHACEIRNPEAERAAAIAELTTLAAAARRESQR